MNYQKWLENQVETYVNRKVIVEKEKKALEIHLKDIIEPELREIDYMIEKLKFTISFEELYTHKETINECPDTTENRESDDRQTGSNGHSDARFEQNTTALFRIDEDSTLREVGRGWYIRSNPEGK